MKKYLGASFIFLGIILIILLICRISSDPSGPSESFADGYLEQLTLLNQQVDTAYQATCASTYAKNQLIDKANKLIEQGMSDYENPDIKSQIDSLQTKIDNLILTFDSLPTCGEVLTTQKCDNILVDLDGRKYCHPKPSPPPVLVWNQVYTTPNPPARTSAMTWTDTEGNFWMFGGIDQQNKPLYDMWKMDHLNNWVSIDVINTPPVYTGGMCWTTPDNKLWLFGGSTPNDLATNQLWVYERNNWNMHTLCCDIPARTGGAVWTDLQGNIWLFGGQTGLTTFTNDLWKWNGNWTLVNPSSTQLYYKIKTRANQPRARRGAMTWTDARDHLWLFGGESDMGLLNDMWRWDGISWSWYAGTESNIALSTNPMPAPLSQGVAWLDEQRLKLYLYTDMGEVWIWMVPNSTWVLLTKVEVPIPRGKTACGVFHNKLIMFGGKITDDSKYSDETWTLT